MISPRRYRFLASATEIALALIVLCTLSTVSPGVRAARLRLGVVDVKDRYTGGRGLRVLARRAGARPRDLTGAVRRRRLHTKGLDAIVIGSFATSNTKVRAGLEAARDELRRWVMAGHTLIVLAQESDDIGEAAWLPSPGAFRWGDRDSDGLRPVVSAHPLLTSPNVFDAGALRGWEIAPRGGDKSPHVFGVHDALALAEGFRTVASVDEASGLPALAVAAMGEGRVVIVAVAIDKIADRPRVKAWGRSARRLLENLIAYASDVKAGRASAEPASPPTSGPWQRRVEVFEDRDGDGRRGEGEPPLSAVRVGHGLTQARTDASGALSLRVDPASPRWIYVEAPAGWRVEGPWFVRDDVRGIASFPLVCEKDTPEKDQERVVVAQISDTHLGRAGVTADALAALVDGLGRTRPAVDLVIATGDLTQRGTREELRAYRDVISRSHVKILNVLGNHDAGRGPDRSRFYEDALGPVFYGFNRAGVHFTVAYVPEPDSPELAWIRQDIAGSGLPSVLVIHHLPRAWLIEALSDLPVLAVLHGHWHGNRVVRFGETTIVSTSTALMTGWDHSPASYRILTFEKGRLVSGELRFVGADHLAVIAVPGEEGADAARRLIVHVGDAFRPPTGVRFVIRDADSREIRVGELHRAGPLTWTADLDGLPAGSYDVTVSCRDGEGAWPALRRSFRLSDPAPSVSPPSVSSQGTWVGYRGGARRTGSARVGLRTPLSLRWARALGGTIHHASPVVDERRVYVAVEDRDGLGAERSSRRDRRSRIVAMDRVGGDVLWSYPTTSSVRQAPTLSGGRLYFQETTGDVTALDVETGERVWRFDLAQRFPPRYAGHWASCAPLTSGRWLVACYHRQPVVLAKATGALIDTLDRQGREDAFTLSSAVFSGGRLYHGGLFSGLSAYSVGADGSASRLWRRRPMTLTSTPLVRGDRVYVQTTRALETLDARSGAELVTSAPGRGGGKGARSPASPLWAGGRIITTDRGGALVAWSPKQRHIVWRRPTGPSDFPGVVNRVQGAASIVSSPAVAAGIVWFGADDGWLYAVRASSGKVVWRRQLGLPVTGGPAIAGRDLYVTDLGGVIYAFSSL